jgi:hypothetical protein
MRGSALALVLGGACADGNAMTQGAGTIRYENGSFDVPSLQGR